ncbi:MAG: exonuclease domain-containing protein [Pontixanthobacter sp.]
MSRFVALDVETANEAYSSICQIGCVEFIDGSETCSASWLVDPEVEFSGYNTYLHGISAEDIHGKPNFAERLPDILAFVDRAPVAAHTHFDRVAFGQASDKASLLRPSWQWLDTARVARRAWPHAKSHGLAKLAKSLDIKFEHHDAEHDARTCGLILLSAIDQTGINLENWTARLQHALDPERQNYHRDGSNEGLLAGESVTFTGRLEIARPEAADMAAALGASVKPGVSKNTTIVVVGDQDLHKLNGRQRSRKHRRAEELIEQGVPIRILSESGWHSLMKEPI